MTFKTVLMAALLSVLSTFSAFAAEDGKITDPYLKTAGAEWDSLFNAGDTARLAALYAADVASMPFNAPTIHGRAALKADFDKLLAQNTARHETLVDEILATDQWAIERARYVLTLIPKAGGEKVVETGRHVVCRKKVKGAWQIAWELWNTDVASPKESP